MTKFKTRILLSCAAITLTCVTLLATAQEHSDCKQGDDCRVKMAQMQASHIAKLHDELKITPTQESAWKNFADNFAQSMGMMADRSKTAAPANEALSAPERLEKHIAMQQQHLDHMQSHLTALKALYAVLTPEQQAILNKHAAHFEHMHQHQQHPAQMPAAAK